MADQVNISWKADSNGKQIFQAALDKWGADKPKSAGAGDFVLDLIRRADRAEAAIETNARLEALGIKELVEMHQRRAQADARMLEQIADIVADAQGKAESAVKAELEALKAGKANLESSIQKVTAELERSRQELEAVKAAFNQMTVDKAESEKQWTADKAESEKQCQQLQVELEKVKGQLNKATLASEQAASQLEQEKLASIALKENAVRHESAINDLQKKANDTETAYRQKIAGLEQELATAQMEREKAELSHQSALNESHKQWSEAEAVYRDEILKLKGEIQNGQIAAEAKIKEMQGEQVKARMEAEHQIEKLQAKNNQLTERLDQAKAEQEQAQKERQEREKAVAELAEAKIKIASLEATVKGQQESISNMGKTMEVLRNFKAVVQRLPVKMEATTMKVGTPDQKDKTK